MGDRRRDRRSTTSRATSRRRSRTRRSPPAASPSRRSRRRRSSPTTDVTRLLVRRLVAHRPGPVARGRRRRSPRTACSARRGRSSTTARSTTTVGDVTVSARERLADRGDDARARWPRARSRSAIELAFNTIGWGRTNLLFAARRRAARRPADLDRVRRQPAPGRGARVGHEQPDHLGRRRLRDGRLDGADHRRAQQRRHLGAGGDHGRRRDERQRRSSPRAWSTAARTRSSRTATVDADGDVTVAASDEARHRLAHRRCTPRSRRRTTPAPASSTSGRTSARRVQVHAALGHARRRLRRQGARRRRDDLPVHGHRRSRSTSRRRRTTPTSATGRSSRRST